MKASSDLTEEQRTAVAEVSQTVTESGVKLRFKLYDKLAALEKLSKAFGLFADRVELSGPGGGPVQVERQVTDTERVMALAFLAARNAKAVADKDATSSLTIRTR